MHEVASLYRFPRHHCLVFDLEYIRSALTDFLTSPHSDADGLHQFVETYDTGKPVSEYVIRKILN